MPAPYIWTPPHQRRGGLPENSAGFAGFVAGNFAGYLLWRHNIVADSAHRMAPIVDLSVRPIAVSNFALRTGLGVVVGAASWALVKAIRPSRNYWDAEIEEIDQKLDAEAEIAEAAQREQRLIAARKAAAQELAAMQ